MGSCRRVPVGLENGPGDPISPPRPRPPLCPVLLLGPRLCQLGKEGEDLPGGIRVPVDGGDFLPDHNLFIALWSLSTGDRLERLRGCLLRS